MKTFQGTVSEPRLTVYIQIYMAVVTVYLVCVTVQLSSSSSSSTLCQTNAYFTCCVYKLGLRVLNR